MYVLSEYRISELLSVVPTSDYSPGTHITFYTVHPFTFYTYILLIYVHTSSLIHLYFTHVSTVAFDLHTCAGSSGLVHNVVLIDVYLDLETPGGRDFG